MSRKKIQAGNVIGGAASGAATGAAVSGPFAPIGAIIGAIIGGTTGALAGGTPESKLAFTDPEEGEFALGSISDDDSFKEKIKSMDPAGISIQKMETSMFSDLLALEGIKNIARDGDSKARALKTENRLDELTKQVEDRGSVVDRLNEPFAPYPNRITGEVPARVPLMKQVLDRDAAPPQPRAEPTGALGFPNSGIAASQQGTPSIRSSGSVARTIAPDIQKSFLNRFASDKDRGVAPQELPKQISKVSKVSKVTKVAKNTVSDGPKPKSPEGMGWGDAIGLAAQAAGTVALLTQGSARSAPSFGAGVQFSEPDLTELLKQFQGGAVQPQLNPIQFRR